MFSRGKLTRSAALMAILLPAVAGCNKKLQRVSRPMLGTVINLTFIAEDKKAPEAAEAVFSEIHRIEKLMSPYRRGSDVERANRLAGVRPVSISRETFSLLEKSNAISRETGGAFDITFASMAHLWNYRDENFRPPSEAHIKAALSLVDYRLLKLNVKQREISFRKRGVEIGLGGIAKGYAVQRGIEILRKKGISAAIVEEGGDLQVLGTRYGKAWRTGIRHPRRNDLLAALDMHDGEAIATSGDYERFKEYGGRKYHHIIDPRTGKPARGLASVSVIAPDPVTADAWATALFVLGPVEGGKLLLRRRELKVVMVDLEMNVYASRSLRKRLQLFGNPKVHWLP